MLKSGATVLAPSLAKLFNSIFKTGIFPTSWSLSTLAVIHKKGNKDIPKNHRGIVVSCNSTVKLDGYWILDIGHSNSS